MIIIMENMYWTNLTLLVQFHKLLTCIPVAFYLTYHSFCLSFPGSPNVTSLTFDARSTTLTCTSTGGPATTVTWRRDRVVITLNATHQQTKRLVDAVNGTYQTVLAVDPSVDWSDIVGTYNCTVENDRGVSSETVVVTGETCSLVGWHTYIPTVHCSYHFCSYTTVLTLDCKDELKWSTSL